MDNFIETDTGVLMTVNGFDPMLRWDGQTAQMEVAGMDAPASGVTMSGSGSGDIVGTYFAYVRYVDRLGFFSNLSAISAEFTADDGPGGSVEGATFAAPISIQSTSHGLATGDIVKIVDVGGNTDANGTWTITVVDANNFTLDGSSGNATYTGSGTWIAGISTINYGSVPIPTDPKVVRRQILRNTDGEANVFYADIDTADLTSTSFSSTRNDDDLATQESQIILGDDGLPLANLRYPPPNHKTTLASNLSRMFLAGEYTEDRGAAIVTNGSVTIQGVGTTWVAGLAGRKFYVVGASSSYDIDSVDVLAQQITLTESYRDASDNFAVYAIRPQPSERRLVYYTPAGQPESWPPTYALAIQEDGDEIATLFVRGSFVYIVERRHIYKLTFQNDPAVDGAIFLGANRGCINNKCLAVVDNDAYMLDEYGVHKFDSGGQITSLSSNIQELFRPGSLYHFHVNWRASRYFHAVVSRPQETVRWFVALEGDYEPHHALCYNYRLQRWWLERYPFAIGSGISGHISNVPYAFLAGENAKVFAMWFGITDLAQPDLGTIRGPVSSAGIDTLTDSTANFSIAGAGSVLNAPIAIVAGLGKGQIGRVTAATSTQCRVDPPWLTQPDITSVYQIGGISWTWKSTWMRLGSADKNVQRNVEVLFEPTSHPCTMDLLLNEDFQGPEIQKKTTSSSQGGGVETISGLPERIIDLNRPSGVVQIQMPRTKEKFSDGRRYNQIELSGVSNQDLIAVYELALGGMGNVAIVSQQP